MSPRPTRVLIVDDSRSFRLALHKQLQGNSQFEIVGEVGQADKTIEAVTSLAPDIVTLDLVMPGMNGFELLEKLKHLDVRVIVVSGIPESREELVQTALQRGAFDVIRKPRSVKETASFVAQLERRMSAAMKIRCAVADTTFSVVPLQKKTERLIVIGASTGGTKAILQVLEKFPKDCPAVVIAQHMIPSMLARFAEQLNAVCNIVVRLARKDDVPQRGVALLAPGDQHLLLKKKNGNLFFDLNRDPKVQGHRPAVDMLFTSVAKAAGGEQTTGVILTGMGRDGADGLLAMRNRGCLTVAEDERDCVVYGMPKAAVENKAAQHVVRLKDIASFVLVTDNHTGGE